MDRTFNNTHPKIAKWWIWQESHISLSWEQVPSRCHGNFRNTKPFPPAVLRSPQPPTVKNWSGPFFSSLKNNRGLHRPAESAGKNYDSRDGIWEARRWCKGRMFCICDVFIVVEELCYWSHAFTALWFHNEGLDSALVHHWINVALNVLIMI